MNGARIRLIGGAIALVAVLVGGWFLGAAPLLTAAKVADDEIGTVVAVNATHEARLAELQAAAADSTAIEGDFAELTAAIPGDSALAALVGQMSADAAAAGVELTSMTAADALLLADAATASGAVPVPAETPVDGEAASGPVDPAVAPVAASPFAPGLVAIPVDLAATGELAALRAFVGLLQNGDRLITVSALTFVEAGDGGDALTLSGTLYVQPAAT